MLRARSVAFEVAARRLVWSIALSSCFTVEVSHWQTPTLRLVPDSERTHTGRMNEFKRSSPTVTLAVRAPRRHTRRAMRPALRSMHARACTLCKPAVPSAIPSEIQHANQRLRDNLPGTRRLRPNHDRVLVTVPCQCASEWQRNLKYASSHESDKRPRHCHSLIEACALSLALAASCPMGSTDFILIFPTSRPSGSKVST